MTGVVTAVRLGQLGDLVMTLPALRWLAADTILQVLTSAQYQPFVQWAVPAARVLAAGDVSSALPADCVLDLHGVPRSRRIVRTVPRAPAAFLTSTRKETPRRRALLIPGLRSLRPRHSWPARHLRAAADVRRHLGLLGAPPSPVPALPSLPSEAGPARLGLVVDAGHPLKRWPEQHFVSLGKAWDGPVRLFGGPESRDLLARIAAETDAETWPDPSQHPLQALARGLHGCAVLVAGDTGPLHVAGALGVPVVGLFGPTPVDAGFWVWGGRGVALSAGADCAPCSMHGAGRCRRRRRVCLDDLSPQRVLAAAQACAAMRRAA